MTEVKLGLALKLAGEATPEQLIFNFMDVEITSVEKSGEEEKEKEKEEEEA